MKPFITYTIAFLAIFLVECKLYAGSISILYTTLPDDVAEFIPAAFPLIIGLGFAAGLLGWGIYKVVSKLCSIIDAKNRRPVNPVE